MNRRPPYCDLCGAEITFSTTEKNQKPMPVDRNSSSDGNVVYRSGKAHVLTKLEIEQLEKMGSDIPRYMPHFATCPNYRPRSSNR